MAEEKLELIKKDYDHLYVARGIAILCVVIGHAILTNVKDILYTFHMPLFFILSGIFARTPDNQKLPVFLWKNIKSLVIPFFLCLGIGFLVNYLLPQWRDNVSWKNFKIALIYINPFFIHGCGVLWFLAVLLYVRIVFYACYRLLFKQTNVFSMLIFTLLFFVLGLNFDDFQQLIHHRIDFALGLVFYAFPFYALGYILKEKLKTLPENINVRYVITIVFCLIMSVFFAGDMNGQVNMGMGQFNNLFLYVFFALCGSIAVLFFAGCISKSKFLRFCGEESMTIYFVHLFVLDTFIYLLENCFHVSVDQTTYNPISILILFYTVAMSLLLAFGKRCLQKRKFFSKHEIERKTDERT